MKRIIFSITACLLLALGILGYLWTRTPPVEAPGTIQFTGGCCLSTPWGDLMVISDEHSEWTAVLEFLPVSVEGDTAFLDFRVGPETSPGGAEVVADPEKPRIKKSVKVGDVIEVGNIEFEIIAIHDALFRRNDAVDISFDYTRNRGE